MTPRFVPFRICIFVSAFERVYATKRVLFFFCAGSELFFLTLYLVKWDSQPLGLSFSMIPAPFLHAAPETRARYRRMDFGVDFCSSTGYGSISGMLFEERGQYRAGMES